MRVRHLEQAVDERRACGPTADRRVARSTRTVAVRPCTRTFRSASRSAGRPSTMLSVLPLVTRSIDSPSSGTGGPPGSKVESGALVAITTRSTVPPVTRSTTQERSRGVTIAGHSRLNADTVMRVPATPSARRGSARRIVDRAGDARSRRPCRRDRPDRSRTARLSGSMRARTETRSMISGGSRERSAEANTTRPRGIASVQGAPGLGRHVELRHEADAARPGLHLERHLQLARRRVPAQVELRLVDMDAAVRIVARSEIAGAGEDAPFHRLQRAVALDLGAQHRRERHVGVEMSVAGAQRQHQVLRRDVAHHRLDGAPAVRLRRHGRGQRPQPARAGRIDGESDAAFLRPRQAQIDVLEGPALAVALVVDHQRAVLQPDLGQRAAVEAERVEAVDPGEQRRRADRS